MPKIYQTVKNGKENLRIIDAVLLEPFVLRIFFDDNEQRVIDFHPFFNSLKGDYKKWNKLSSFKKFKIEN